MMLLRSQTKKNVSSTKRLNIDEFITKTQLHSAALRLASPQKLPHMNVDFHRLINDGTRQNFRRLICLKCIISQQLSKMPRSYITKILFDGRHECIAIEVSDGRMIGGICFRCFQGQQFVEIVFLAVQQAYKKRKFGSRLIDNLKELMQERKKNLVLTYADNTAVGFFRKQGFEVIIETPEKPWSGFIKVYLEGTLMECKIYDNLKYTKFQQTVKQQKSQLITKIKSIIKNEIKYPGLAVQKLKQTHHVINSEDTHANFPFPVQLIPGVIETHWSTHQERKLQQNPQISIMLQQLQPIECIRKHCHSKIFRGLTPLLSAPKYQNHFILDLPTLQKKIISGRYLGHMGTKKLCKQYASMIRDYKMIIDRDSDDYKDINSLEQKIGPILVSLSDLKIRFKVQYLFKQETSKVKKSKNLKT